MPLVVVAGLPCAGKSRVAAALAEHLRAAEGAEVALVSEEALGLERAAAYADAAAEKVTRGLLKSAVERALSASAVVVLDSLNYVKGVRYELYCVAKTLRSTHCVVWVATPPETCRQWNAESGAAWPEDTLESLLGRFEAPNERQRWDRPLFRVCPGGGGPDGEELDAAAVADALLRGAAPAGAAREAVPRPPAAGFMAELERRSQEVVDAAASQLPDAVAGDELRCGGAVVLRLARVPALAELRRLRRAFCRLAEATPGIVASSGQEPGVAFGQYVNGQLG